MKRLIMATAISATVFIAGCSSDGTPAVQGTTTPVAAATAPTTAPAAPASTAAASLSIFSGAYAALSGLNIDPDWDGGTGASAALETIAGNEVLKISNLGFQGIEFGSEMDVSAMDTLHIDYWTENSSGFDVYAISSDGAEVAKSIGITTGSWQSVDIPLSDFAGVDLTKVHQLKIVGNGDVYLDNIYFYDTDATTPAAVDYIYSSDASVTPNWVADTDFSYDSWGNMTGASTDLFEGGYAGDADYNPVWQTNGSSWGSVVAMAGFPAGFASGYGSMNFKVKLDSGTVVKTKFGTGQDKVYSTADGTALGNGWYQMEIPMSDFGSVSADTEFAIWTDALVTMYLTDIGFGGQQTVPPVASIVPDYVYTSDATASPKWVADTDFSYDSWGNLTGASTDLFEGGYTGDSDYSPVWQTNGSSWGSVVAMAGFPAGFASGYGSMNFKVKLDSGTVVKTKFGTGTDKVYSTADGTALGNGWYQMDIPMSDFGSVSADTEFAIWTDAFVTMYLTDIGFSAAPVVSTVLDYVYTSDAASTPNWVADTDFNYDSWGNLTGASTDLFEGGYTGDPDYSPVWQTNGSSWGSVVAMAGFPAGFASSYGSMNFKVKLDSGTVVKTKFGTGTDKVYSTADGTALGNGWYQMEIPMSDFGSVSADTEFAIWTDAFVTMYLTDIGFSGSQDSTPTVTPATSGVVLNTNGDFETGDLDGWTLYGALPVISTDSFNGSYSANLVAPEGQASVLKLERIASGAVQSGQVLEISFNMKGVFGPGGVLVPKIIWEDDANGAQGVELETIAVPTAAYTTYTYIQTAGNVGNGLSLEFSAVCGAVAGCSANAHIDDVTITVQ